MSAKKGFELLKTLGMYFTESDGFDKVLKGVSHVEKNELKWKLKKNH